MTGSLLDDELAGDAPVEVIPNGSTRRHRGGRALAAGVVVGLAACVALVTGGVLELPPSPELDLDRRVEFVDAYARSRNATYVLQSEFRREMTTGAVLQSLREVVQRPPDRVLRQFGGISGEINGHMVICSTAPDEAYECRQGAPMVQSFAEANEKEIANLRDYFEGPVPLYRATRAEDGCYELRQVSPVPDPPYGKYALRFDGATGAITELDRHLDLATETLRATFVSPVVTDADFDLRQDPEFAESVERPDPPPAPAGTQPAAAPDPPTGEPAASSVPGAPEAPEPEPAPDANGAPAARTCAPGEAAAPCSDEELIGACVTADDRRLLARELWNRQQSINDPRLAGNGCGLAYATELLAHGYQPFDW